GGQAQEELDPTQGLAVQSREPAKRRVVVVSSRIDDAVRLVHVRQVWAVGGTAESKLQHAHSGKPEVAAQCLDVGGDDSEILGEDWQLAQIALQKPHQLLARSVMPCAATRIGRAGWHRPMRRQRPEMIDAQHVDTLELASHARAPQREAVAAHGVPVVKRVAPELPGLGKVVGRDAGDGGRLPGGIELELAAVHPGLGGIGGYVEWEVPEESDVAGLRMLSQALPLNIEREL